MEHLQTPVPLKRRLAALNRIFTLYDTFTRPLPLACQPFCATCCTCNMTLTTLEGHYILSLLDKNEQELLFTKIRSVSGKPRFQPQLTTNRIAALCRDGKPVPHEMCDPTWGMCPLLLNDACSLYRLRPFGCRCMLSRTNCSQTGYADIDDVVLTLNNLFLQYIEHIDADGMTGNLIDILLFLEASANRATETGDTGSVKGHFLVANHPIPVLMIPPEHRRRVQPILHALQHIGESDPPDRSGM